jgi:hypothetical protein
MDFEICTAILLHFIAVLERPLLLVEAYIKAKRWYISFSMYVARESKVIPVTCCGGPLGGGGGETSRISHFLDNRLTESGEVVSLTHRQHSTSQAKFSRTYFCYRLSQPQVHIAAGGIRSIEKNPLTSSGFETASLLLVA